MTTRSILWQYALLLQMIYGGCRLSCHVNGCVAVDSLATVYRSCHQELLLWRMSCGNMCNGHMNCFLAIDYIAMHSHSWQQAMSLQKILHGNCLNCRTNDFVAPSLLPQNISQQYTVLQCTRTPWWYIISPHLKLCGNILACNKKKFIVSYVTTNLIFFY